MRIFAETTGAGDAGAGENKKEMKKTMWLAALALCAGQMHGQARVDWDSAVHDFGAFHEELGKVKAEFRFRNTGTEAAVISDVRVSCGCTRAEYTTGAIAPGDTGTVSVTYDASGRPGRFEKSVYVYTNTEPEKNVLKVKGVVIGSEASLQSRYPVTTGTTRYERPSALLGAIDKGHIKNVYFRCYNGSADTLTAEVKDLPGWLEGYAIPKAVPAGEQFQINFYVTSNAIGDYGLVTDTVTLVTHAGEAEETLRLPVVVTVNENFGDLSEGERAQAPVARLSTALVSIGMVDEGATGTGTFSVSNGGKRPMAIRRVYSGDAGVTATADKTTVKPGESATVTVKAGPEAMTDGVTDARVVVITNDPENPTQTVRVTAEQKKD